MIQKHFLMYPACTKSGIYHWKEMQSLQNLSVLAHTHCICFDYDILFVSMESQLLLHLSYIKKHLFKTRVLVQCWWRFLIKLFSAC